MNLILIKIAPQIRTTPRKNASGLRPSSFVMWNTPVEVQFTQPGVSIIRAAPQTLAKGDKITLTVERIDGGKLRSTCASCYPIRRI